MKIKIFYSTLLMLILFSCKNDKPQDISTTKKEEISPAFSYKVEEKPDIMTLCKTLVEMDRKGLENKLSNKNIGLFEASYANFFLAGKYVEEGEFDKGFQLHQKAADLYLNPLSMHWLAFIYFKKEQEIKKDLKKGQARDLKQDFNKSYYYIHRAINSAILTMDHFNDRFALDDVNRYAIPIIEAFEKRDSVKLKNFDFAKAEENGKKDLVKLKSEFEKLYLRK